MEDEVFDNLPDDPELAFVHLEDYYRRQLNNDIEESDDGAAISYFKSRYINQIIAAAKALNIISIKDYELPKSEIEIWDYYKDFSADVMNLIIQIKINRSRRKKQYSVSLSGPEKQKVRHYIEHIRQLVENSEASTDKKEAIFKKLSELTLEIDRDRTRFEIIADGIRGMARLSGDVEREGAEPWWKWVKLILRVVDEAKEKEGQTSLPRPADRKRLEAPRKQIPAPKPSRDLDDEIPF